MGRIQSSIGLITGVPIADTVEQLIALNARPRDLLVNRTQLLQSEQSAITELTAAVLGVQLAGRNLAKTDQFSKTTAASSNSSLLSATVTGKPAVGSFQFTPLQAAQAQQLLSSGFASLDGPIGAGQITIARGGHVNEGISLSRLNDGLGVGRGKIRITDRSGASAEIDLRFAQTIDEVLTAINEADGVNVTATAVGDAIKLTDDTGQTISNLRVQEVSSGTTAADLGLANIDAAAAEATGEDVLGLHEGTLLTTLLDGNGLSLRQGVTDLNVTFRDGSADLQVDLSALAAPGVRDTATLGDLLETINAADPARLQASISANGDHVEFVDLTADTGGTFSVASAFGGSVAEELGLTAAAAGDTITGSRLQAGLKDTLLRSLGGGNGLGTLGDLQLQDRSSAAATVDLSDIETLGGVIDAINAAGIAIVASVNRAGNGIQLRDTSGGTGNLIAANGDASNTADKLQITHSAAAKTVDSGSLHRQHVSRQTKLADYNGGAGVQAGKFLIVDSGGDSAVIDTDDEDVRNIGDVLDLINSSGIGVTANINDTGDGIQLVDTAGGESKLRVEASGGKTTAADLLIAGEAGDSQVIDGSTTRVVEISETDTLEDLTAKLNDLGLPLAATVFSDGSGTAPHRLSLVSQKTGLAGRLLIDTTAAGFNLEEIVSAQDARLLFGSIHSGGVVATSSDDTFNDLLAGVALTVKGSSTDPVTVSVSQTSSSLTTNVKAFVDLFNKLRAKLDQHTFFNAEDNSTGFLFGSNETLRVESELNNLLTGRFFGVGDVQSLEQIGISINDDGTLAFDQTKLDAQYAADPASLEKFFTTESSGFAAKLDRLTESLVGRGSSLLVSRAEALSRKIDTNQERIEALTGRLDRQREQLLKQFYTLETTIAKLQDSLTAVQGIQALPPLQISN